MVKSWEDQRELKPRPHRPPYATPPAAWFPRDEQRKASECLLPGAQALHPLGGRLEALSAVACMSPSVAPPETT